MFSSVKPSLQKKGAPYRPLRTKEPMTEILGKFSRAGVSDCREIGSSGRFWAKTDPRGVFGTICSENPPKRGPKAEFLGFLKNAFSTVKTLRMALEPF